MQLLVFATLKEAKAFCPFLKEAKQGEIIRVEEDFLVADILITGISVVNSVFFLTRVLAKKRYELVINIGIAGTFTRDKFNLGEIVICKREVWAELGVEKEGVVERNLLNFPLYQNNKVSIQNSLDLLVEDSLNLLTKKINYPLVNSLTVSTVTGSKTRANLLKEKFLVDIENMEGFGLAYTCFLFNTPFLEIRSISNVVGSRSRKEWDLVRAFEALRNLFEEMYH